MTISNREMKRVVLEFEKSKTLEERNVVLSKSDLWSVEDKTKLRTILNVRIKTQKEILPNSLCNNVDDKTDPLYRIAQIVQLVRLYEQGRLPLVVMHELDRIYFSK